MVALLDRGIVKGFADGSFKPNRSLTRAELAAMLRAAFPNLKPKRTYPSLGDVPANHWAAASIRYVYETGFLSGLSPARFGPDQTSTRLQVLLALVGGLDIRPATTLNLAELYQDHSQIPTWAQTALLQATAASLVVNPQNLRSLRPLEPATRADVAAFIYQALVWGKSAPAIASPHIVPPLRTAAVGHAREFRAAWISTVWNIDWPSQPGLSSDRQKAELIAMLDRLKGLNLNAVILQVRPEGDAIYPSSLEPFSYWITGSQGRAPDYDPLEFAIDQCHQRGMELHAWFNPYRASTSNYPKAANHISRTQPQVVYPWGNQLWMDPGSKRVQDQTAEVILDVVRRYDLDGVHFDDYFYPYPIAGQNFPDQATYDAYRARGGQLARSDWRRDNVNQLMQRVSQAIRALKPQVKFGISPFGIYRPGQPPQIRGMDAYEQLYADALKWLQAGWVDYIAPQLYWRIDQYAQSYPVLLQWWAENNPAKRHIYAGNNLALLGKEAWNSAEIERQITLTRDLKHQQVLGNIFFSSATLAADRQQISTHLQQNTYPSPVLPPAMPWLPQTAPALPQVRLEGDVIVWQGDESVRAWTIYGLVDKTWELLGIFDPQVNAVSATVGTYAICGVNAVATESLGVVITVGKKA